MKALPRIARIIIGLALIGTTTALQAQKSETTGVTNLEGTSGAIGLRAGETSGLTLKHFFANTNAIEGIISVWPYTLGVTGLYEFNKPTKAVGLNFYYGLGGHVNIGTARYRAYYLYRDRDYVYVRRSNEVALGVDFIGGLEYKSVEFRSH